MNIHIPHTELFLRLEKALADIESSSEAFDLAAHAKKYPRSSAPIPELENLLQEKIRDYDPVGGYGKNYLQGHLVRTPKALSHSLVEAGYSPEVAQTLQADFSVHDIGKTKQPYAFWPYTKDKPTIPDHIKMLRPQHTTLILDVLAESLHELGIDPSENEFQRLVRMAYMGKYHHENHLGTGPHALPPEKIDPVLSKAITIDTADGKLKALVATTDGDIDPEMIIRGIFADMATGKLKDHFRPEELDRQQALYMRNPGLLFAA